MAGAKQQEGKVVVYVALSSEYVDDAGKWVARMNGMGIIASRGEADAAVQAATALFAEEVQVHRELGNLELWLNRFDVDWDWYDRYEERGDREYRDVSIPKGRLPLLSQPETSRADHNTQEYALAA